MGQEPDDALSFDWDRYPELAMEWEEHEPRFQGDWEKQFPHGPAWAKISDYHRYGFAGRRLFPDDPREDVIHRIHRGYERGEWDTRDPWPLIESALRAGWEEAGAG